MAPLEDGGGHLGPKLFSLHLKGGMLFPARPGLRATPGPLQPATEAPSSTSHATLPGHDLSAEIRLVRGARRRRGVVEPTATAKAKAVLAKRRQGPAVYIDGLGLLRSESVRH